MHLLILMAAVRFANVDTATFRSHYRCYLLFALLLLPSVCVTAATFCLRYCCYLLFALLLLPSVHVTAVTFCSRSCCYLLFAFLLLPSVRVPAATFCSRSCCYLLFALLLLPTVSVLLSPPYRFRFAVATLPFPFCCRTAAREPHGYLQIQKMHPSFLNFKSFAMVFKSFKIRFSVFNYEKYLNPFRF
ncbi:hypothetical protein [Methanimicrococcus blatticola]|uniref:hypothetical protein n=1 Tax=Methanimicrococcus blatticola TaxID=91560 RepID=UPI001061690A|nr:hypothetical protein [Methanimicrococcus blatticola]